MNENNKLDRFVSVILSDADNTSLDILNAIKNEREHALSATEEVVLNESYKLIKTEVSKIRSNESRRISKKLLDCNRALFIKRNEMANDVFEEIHRRISAFTNSAEYKSRLVALAKEAAASIKSKEILISMRTQDMQYKDLVLSALPEYTVTFSESDIKIGGLVVESLSGHVRVDATFDSSVKEKRENFNELFGLSVAEFSF